MPTRAPQIRLIFENFEKSLMGVHIRPKTNLVQPFPPAENDPSRTHQPHLVKHKIKKLWKWRKIEKNKQIPEFEFAKKEYNHEK